MSYFPRIRQLLAAAFAVDVGLSEAAQRQLLERSLQNKDWRCLFEAELREAFVSRDTCWSELLYNDKYEVIEVDSETEAREIAATLLWEATFPSVPLPERPNGEGG